ncbi:hypothetical protein BDZ94DRAFT_1265331 [Collybia nuda]|uniref:Uncharacterized protein n=1 Tax=Collybia nuda TaxID=64659 RepID=A0A9P5Y3C3_9AGAR|nr:hypothetical protein BDZ94DRAFT_1265331 [Collybia nuda]
MSDEDSLAETGPSTNDYYASEFRQHLAQFRSHLTGSDGKRLLPSYIPPTGYWTSLEKDAFFHGLSIYSRFRPDLIASCICTKSVVDVCAYIDALEEGISRSTMRHTERTAIEGSMEVSDAWVQWEEKRSADLVLLECDWEEENYEKQKDGREEDMENDWIKEKTLRQLDIHDLTVFETILRTGQSESGYESADHSLPSARFPTTDEMIDPVLLEISGPVEEKTISPSELSPTSRRRFQKRLYMRKKRAEKEGNEFTSVATKLRPGRKARVGASQKRRPKIENSSYEGNHGEDFMNLDHAVNPHAISESRDTRQNSEPSDDSIGHARHNKGGLTKPYKIRKEFASQGIDVDFLSQGDLGLFHYSTLGRLMELYKSGYSKSKTSLASTVSMDTIRLMTALAIEFISEVVHRTIIFCEQERTMKGNIKVYGRMRDDITSENVDRVLEMMGSKGLTKARYFADLLHEGMAIVPGAPGDLKDDSQGSRDCNLSSFDKNSDGDGENEYSSPCSQDKSFSPLSLARELHPLLIHLPKSFTNRDPLLEDTLMPIDTNETELLNELQEEQEIDDVDGNLARIYESKLWKKLSGGI